MSKKIKLKEFREKGVINAAIIKRLFMKIKTGDYLDNLKTFLDDDYDFASVFYAEEILEERIKDYRELSLRNVLRTVGNSFDEESIYTVLYAIYVLSAFVVSKEG